MALSEEVMDDYKSSLGDLSVNSKPQINMLTMLAEENEQHAPEIVKVIEDHINKCELNKKLPALYLMDSIMKNLEKSSYRSLFTKNIVQLFTAVFEQVDEKTRASMFKLRQTWSSIVPNEKLYMIDVKIKNLLDPAWPITATPPNKTSIHVNPKFLHGQSSESERSSPEVADEPAEVGDPDDQEVIMRQQLIAKHQELLRLQQARLELELAEAEEKLKLQKKVGKAHSTSPAQGLPLPPEIRGPLMEMPQALKDLRHRPGNSRIRDPRLKHTEPLIPSVSPSAASIPIASQPLGPSVISPGTFHPAMVPPVGILPAYTGAHGPSPNPVNQYNGLPMGSLPYPGLPLPAQRLGAQHKEVFSGEVFNQEVDEARFSDENDSDSSRSSASSWSQRQPVNVRDPRVRGDVHTDFDQSQHRHSVDTSKPVCEPLPSVYGEHNQRAPDNYRSREREKSSIERESNSVKITSSRIQPYSPHKSLSAQQSSKGTNDMKLRENNRSDTKLQESFEEEHKKEERKKKDSRNVSKDKVKNGNNSKRKSESSERPVEKSPKLSSGKSSPHKGSGDKASKGDKKGNKPGGKTDGDVIGIHMKKGNEKLEVISDKNVSMTKGLLKSSAEEIDIDDGAGSNKVSEKRHLEDQESHRASKKIKMESSQPAHGDGDIHLQSTDMGIDSPEQNEDLKGNILNDISDLFGGEDEDLRADVHNPEWNTLALKSPGCKNWDQFKASQPEKFAYDIELKKHRKDSLLENKLHRAPEEDEDIDFRCQSDFQRQMSTVDDVKILQEHSLDQHSDIFQQAHMQLIEGGLIHEQHQDQLKRLGELVHIQKLQEANIQLSGEPVSDHSLQSGSNESLESRKSSRDITPLEKPLERFKIPKRNAEKKEDAGPVGHGELLNLYPDIPVPPNAHPFTSVSRLETFTPQLPHAEMFEPQLPRDNRFDVHVPQENRFGNLNEGHSFQDGPQGRSDPSMEVPLRHPLDRIPADPGVSEVLPIFPGNRDPMPDHFVSPRDRDWRCSRDGRNGHFDVRLSRDEDIRHDADMRGFNRDIDTRIPAVDTNMTGQVWNTDKLSQAVDIELRVQGGDIDTRGQIVHDVGMISSGSDVIAQCEVRDADMRGLTMERDFAAPNSDADMRSTFRDKEMLVPVKDTNVSVIQGQLEEARDVRFPNIVMDRIGPEFRPGPPIRDIPPLVKQNSPGRDVQRKEEDVDFRKDDINRRCHRSKGRFDDEREETGRVSRREPHGKAFNRRGKYGNCDVPDNSWRKQQDSECEGTSPIYDEQRGRRDRSRETKWPQDRYDRRSQDRRGPHERYRDQPLAERGQSEDRPTERPHWERRQQDENVPGRPPHSRRGHLRGHWRDQTRESWPDSQDGFSRDWDSRNAEGRSEMKIPPTEYPDDNLQKKQWREYSGRDRNFNKQDGERQGRQREDGPEDVRYDRNHGLPAWQTVEDRDQDPPKRGLPMHDNRPLIPKEELEMKQTECLPTFLGPVNPNALEFRNEPFFNESIRPGGPTMPLPGQGGPHVMLVVPRGSTPHGPGFGHNMQRNLPPVEPVDLRGPQPGVETYIDKFGDPRFRCFADMGPLVNEEVVIGKRNYEIKLGAPPRRIQWTNGVIEVFADPSKRGIMVDGVLLYKFGERVKEVNIRGKNEKIFYHGRPLNLWIDGQYYEVRVDSPPKTLIINGKPHRFQIDGRDMMILIDKHEKGVFGGEPRFVFIDDERMELRFDPPPRHILIDGEPCELKLNTQQPCVNVKGRLFGIRFDGPPRDVFIDGIRYNIFTDHAVKLRVGNKFHYVALGGPCHEIIIDGKWFELRFNEPPKEINVNNQVLMIQLPGPPPEVKILPEIVLQQPPHVFHMMPNQRLPVLPPPGMPPMFGVPVSIPQVINTPVRMNMPPNIMPSAVPVPVGPAVMPGIGLAPLFSASINNAPALQTGNVPSVMSSLVSMQTPAPNVLSNLVSVPTPAPIVPAQPIDLDSLLTNLVKSGIIKQKETEAKTEMNIPISQPVATNPEIVHPPEYDNLDKKQIPQQEVQVFDYIQDMTEFDTNEMKILPTGAIQRLYCGVQCTSCGQRFILDDSVKTERYRQHLDWHFRQKKRGKDDTKVMRCRKWYYGISDWIQYEDVVETDGTGRSNFFEQQQQQQQQQTETGTPTTLQSSQISLPEGVLVVKCPPAAGNDNEDMCDICHEPFEQFWDEELEEWHLRDAIKVSNKTYHPICYEDYTDISEGTPTPSVLNVTEPAFSVKKSLTYEESSQDGMQGDHASFEEERRLPNHTLLLKTEDIKIEPDEVRQSQPKSMKSTSQHFATSTSNVKVEGVTVCVKSEPDEVSVELPPHNCVIDSNYSCNKTDIKTEPVDNEMENEITAVSETTMQGDSNINISLLEDDNESNIIQRDTHRVVGNINIDRTMEIDSESVPVNTSDNSVIILESDVDSHDTSMEDIAIPMEAVTKEHKLTSVTAPEQLLTHELVPRESISPTSCTRLSQVKFVVKSEDIDINPEVLEIASNASTPTRDELPSPPGLDI